MLFPRKLRSVHIEVDLLSINLKLKQLPRLQEQTQVNWSRQINRLYKGLFALHTAAVINIPDTL